MIEAQGRGEQILGGDRLDVILVNLDRQRDALQTVRPGQLLLYDRQNAVDFFLVQLLPDFPPSWRCRQQAGPIASDDEFIVDCRLALFDGFERGIPSRLEDGAKLPEHRRVLEVGGI